MKKIKILVVAFTLANLAAVALFNLPTYAQSSGFQAGRIIDDSVFFNPTGMTATEIQTFLNSKVPVCDTYHTKSSSVNDSGPPYTCLKSYSQSTPSKPYEAGLCNALTSKSSRSAASIIHDVANACGINPKVLIVMLQKEQSLITDTWPWELQYNRAMGYACPDSGPNNSANCDASYYGFFNQVYSAARQFKRYAQSPTSWGYRAYRDNYIQYNPNAGCGGSNVYIQNQATAGLYVYTPYQPNANTLAATPGTTVNCGAYGNLNFWRTYNNWFGPTTGANFAAQYHKQSPYPILDSGARRTIFFEFKNIGTYFWKDDASTFPGYYPVRLAGSGPINRTSGFKDKTWLSASRPSGKFAKVFERDGITLASDQHTVHPGQIGRFEITINANSSIPGGVHREYFQPILDGAPNPQWNMGSWVHIDVGVHKPYYQAKFHKQNAYPTIPRGSAILNFFEFKNTGKDPWFDNVSVPLGKQPVRLATSEPINRTSLLGSSWGIPSRPAINFSKVYENDGVTLAANQHIVKPGQIGRFEFGMSAPANMATGYYKEHFQIIAEGAPDYTWNLGWQSTGWLGVTVK